MITRRALLQLPFAVLPMMAMGQSPRCLMVFEGNSLSALNNVVVPTTWVTRLLDSNAARAHGVCAVNAAVSGDDLRGINRRASVYVDPLRDLCEVGVCVLWEGTNSLCVGGFDAAQVFEQHRQYCLARKGAGWLTVMGTIANRRFVSIGVEDDGQHEVARLQFNQLVRDHASEFNAVLDVGADAMLGADHAAWNPTYFRDGIHLTDAGAQRVADLAELIVVQMMAHRVQFFPVVTV